MANKLSQGKCSNKPASTIALAPPRPSSAGWKMKCTRPRKLRVCAKYLAAPSSMVVWPSWPQACITPSFVEACAKRFASRIGKASMSARNPMAAVSLPFCKTPTTPVPPMPVWTVRPNSRSFAATNSAVRCSWKPSSGWAWMSRRQRPSSPRFASIASTPGMFAIRLRVVDHVCVE